MIVPEYEQMTIRLPWKVICKLAVKALINHVDFDGAVELAVRDRLAKLSAPTGAQDRW